MNYEDHRFTTQQDGERFAVYDLQGTLLASYPTLAESQQDASIREQVLDAIEWSMEDEATSEIEPETQQQYDVACAMLMAQSYWHEESDRRHDFMGERRKKRHHRTGEWRVDVYKAKK